MAQLKSHSYSPPPSNKGEPRSVRDAYDRQFAKEQQDRATAKKGGK